MYYSKPLKSYEAVCQILDQAGNCDAQPVHWRKPLYAAIDELNEALAPAEQIRTVEQLTIVLLKLEWAIQRGQTDKIDAARERLAQLNADWRSMVEVDVEVEVGFAPVQDTAVAPPRSIAQLQDLLAEAEQDTPAEPEEFVAPPRWLSLKAPEDETPADHQYYFDSHSFEDAAETADWCATPEIDSAADEQIVAFGHENDAEPEDEFQASSFDPACAEVEGCKFSGEDLHVSISEPHAEVPADPWVPRNEGLPFGKPSFAGKEFAPEAASDTVGIISDTPNIGEVFDRPTGADGYYAPGSDDEAGIDFLAASRGSFAQSRIDFRDPYREEEIESVAEALERITVRNRFC